MWWWLDGKINAMRKIKEMSGNNAMLRRREGGEANSGYSPTQDGSWPGERAKDEHIVYFHIFYFPFKGGASQSILILS